MGLDDQTRASIDRLATEWVQAKKMFSAFEISLAAKEAGVQARHRELKDYVHEAVAKAAEGQQYSRTLMDVGAPQQAWVYHPMSESPYAYVPLQRSDRAAPPKKKKLLKLRAPTELRAGAAMPGSNDDGVFGADLDGALRIPAELCKSAGIVPGIGLVAEAAPASLRLRKAGLMELAEPSLTIEASGGLLVPMAVLATASIDRLQGYAVEAEKGGLDVRGA
ncbi:MAG: hypothetical protein U1E65_28180 [Myxococcota bacterium]